MTLDRRDVLLAGLAAAVAAGFPGPAVAAALDDLAAGFTGGAEPVEGGVTLILPAIAEDGSSVPVSIDAPGAVAILLFAPENPEPVVVTCRFGPAAGSRILSTRIRLARSQEVIALARMADGSVRSARSAVEVTVGGCD